MFRSMTINRQSRGYLADHVRHLLLQNRKHHEVLHRHFAQIRLIRNSKRSPSSRRLIIRVHRPIILNAVRRTPRPSPVLRVSLAIGPVRGEAAVKRERGLALVVGELDDDLSAGGEGHGGPVAGEGFVAAAVCLHPPGGFGELVEGDYGCVCVLVVGAGVGASLLRVV